VIIPSIDRDSLQLAINSVDSQSHPPFEVIVVDDSLAQTIPRGNYTIVRTGGGRGVSHARNLGVLRAEGELIAFLDDDDMWMRDKIKSQLHEITHNNLDILVSSALVNGKVRPSLNSILKVGQDPLELLYSKPHLFKSQTYLPTGSYMVRRDVFDRVKFEEQLIERENLRFLSDAFQANLRISQSEDVLIEVNYRSSNSLSRMSFEIEESWLHFLQEADPKFAKNFLIESSRNFARRKEYDDAKKMLKMNPFYKPLRLTFLISLSLLSRVRPAL